MKDDIKASFESKFKGIIFVMLAVHEQVVLLMHISISISISIYQSIYLSIYLYLSIYIYLYPYPSIHLSISIYLSLYIYIYTHAYIYINIYIIMYISDNFNSMCKKGLPFTQSAFLSCLSSAVSSVIFLVHPLKYIHFTSI